MYMCTCVCVCVLVSLRRSVLFPLISLVILLVGEVIAIFSHYDRRKKVLTFVSGILFVIAGKFPSISLSLCPCLMFLSVTNALVSEVISKIYRRAQCQQNAESDSSR